ncbi:MAG: PAS domain-containing sensor histidine kinase [Desulfobacteraceae bacterium]|nr:MAG: PAS domain-containing sensor histidine kinase [Desulfobacteraceae bacterium]
MPEKFKELTIETIDKNLLDRSPDCIYLHDLKGNFLDANLAALDLLGLTKNQLAAMNFSSLLKESQIDRALKAIREILEKGYESGVTEYELVTRNGETIYMETKGILIYQDEKPCAILGIGRDITHRRQTEAALRKSEEKYRFLIESATDGIIIVQDDVIRFANSRMVEMTGYSKEEFVNGHFADFIVTDNREDVIRQFRELVSSHKTIKTISFKGWHKHEKEIIVQAKIVEIEWEEKPAGLVFLRDITAEKQYETRVMQTQKMEAIGTLSGGIAHDFNNILGAIVLNAEMALDDVEQDTEAEYSIQQILKSSQRAKRLVDQILTFSREAITEKKPLEFGIIIKETLKMLRSVIPATINITQYIPTDIGMVMADPAQLQQMVVNLINNAVDAMKENGGDLEITLGQIEVEESPAGFDVEPGEYIQLRIKDTGKGIRPKDLKRIFDPFFTTRKSENRTGLGLSVVHGIVSVNNGFIKVDNEEGIGTVFSVSFPRVKEMEMSVKQEMADELAGTGKILFVDDEPALIDAGKRLLQRLGYEVITAESGMKAHELFCRNPESFDLVITDTTMPNMTGIELSKELHAVRPDLPIIVCSGFSELISAEIASEMGIQAYIMKPFIRQEMADAIRKALSKNP